MKTKDKIRNPYIDIVKAILIILVLIGHSIQYGSGSNYMNNQLFFNNVIFKFIYSFHMPLFIMISGYLSYNSINKNSFFNILKTKICTLIIPIFLWTIPVLIFKLNEFYSIREFIKLCVTTFSTNLWFLWSLFYLTILVKLINKFCEDNIFIYIVIFLLTFIIPDEIIFKRFILQFYLYSYMYIFFIAGYLTKKHNLLEKINKSIINKTLIINTYLFIMLLIPFSKDIYIYTTGINIINNYSQLFNDLYRYLIGFVGSIEILLIIYKLTPFIKENIKDKLLYLGKNTLGIYIISSIIHPYILPMFTNNLSNINYLFICIETIIILVISITAIELIKINKYTSKYLLGEK